MRLFVMGYNGAMLCQGSMREMVCHGEMGLSVCYGGIGVMDSMGEIVRHGWPGRGGFT